jgi:DNA-binding GntR family transcriptional regulator
MTKRSNPLNLPELADSAGGTSQASAYLRLRHALRQLSTEKALLTLENRRIKVPEMTATRFEELINIRCTLEVYAAKRAMPYINKISIDDLERLDREINQAVQDNDWPLSVLLNQQFHSSLYLSNPEQIAMPMIESVWLQLGPFMRIAGRFQKDLYLVDRHREALEALHRNDESALGAAIEADIRDAVGGLRPEIIGKIIEDRTLEKD